MMQIDFTSKTAIVTGGSRGIGKKIAEMLLKLNCKVIITSRGKKPKWTNEYPNCFHEKLDFLDEKYTKKFLKKISSLSAVNILINNAGMHKPEPVYDINEENWTNILKVNLNGPMLITREVASKMKGLKDGKIVNISSIAGIVSKPDSSAYSASKSGLIGFTRACALDLAPYNILVNAICPGPTSTDMVKNILSEKEKKAIREKIPLKRFAKVEEIANFAVFLCSNNNSYVTGQTIVIDGGATSQ